MEFYLTPVTGARMVGRRAEIGRLVADLSDKESMIGVLLTGPRRVGKTSLLLEAKRRLECRGVVAVYASARRAAFGRLDEFVGHLIGQTLEAFGGRMGLRTTKLSSILATGGGAPADLLKGAGVTAEIGESIARALSFAPVSRPARPGPCPTRSCCPTGLPRSAGAGAP